MAVILQYSPILFILYIVFSVSLIYEACAAPAVATWYGPPNGDGSDGGACGYASAVGQAPFSSIISAGGPSLYKAGQGCGICYQVKCSSNKACSGKPVTVVITDECPGCPEAFHFDLSGRAFGELAKPGQADALRNVGKIQVDFIRVPCNYGRFKITLVTKQGSNPFFLSFLPKFVNKGGDLQSIEIKEAGSGPWLRMQRDSGALWKFQSSTPLKAPISVRLTQSGKAIVATNVIPNGWQPGQSFVSNVNF